MNFSFGFNLNSHLHLLGYAVEAEISPFYWKLYLKRAPEKGLTMLLRVGPISVFLYNLKQQDEWFEELLRSDGLVPVKTEQEEEKKP